MKPSCAAIGCHWFPACGRLLVWSQWCRHYPQFQHQVTETELLCLSCVFRCPTPPSAEQLRGVRAALMKRVKRPGQPFDPSLVFVLHLASPARHSSMIQDTEMHNTRPQRDRAAFKPSSKSDRLHRFLFFCAFITYKRTKNRAKFQNSCRSSYKKVVS